MEIGASPIGRDKNSSLHQLGKKVTKQKAILLGHRDSKIKLRRRRPNPLAEFRSIPRRTKVENRVAEYHQRRTRALHELMVDHRTVAGHDKGPLEILNLFVTIKRRPGSNQISPREAPPFLPPLPEPALTCPAHRPEFGSSREMHEPRHIPALGRLVTTRHKRTGTDRCFCRLVPNKSQPFPRPNPPPLHVPNPRTRLGYFVSQRIGHFDLHRRLEISLHFHNLARRRPREARKNFVKTVRLDQTAINTHPDRGPGPRA